MCNFKGKYIILIFLLLFKMTVLVKGASFQRKYKENESNEVKKLSKRGQLEAHSDNVYGPPLHISSGLLHFEDTPQIKEPTVIYQGSLSHHLPIWNDVSTEWQPIIPHAVLQTSSVEHFPQPAFGGEGFTLGAHESAYNIGGGGGGIGFGEGLHTQIIGSTAGHGHNTIKLDDKIDLSNNIGTKEKYYIKSYG